jgi:predicted amidohydrolase
MKFSVALAQISPTLGNLEKNMEKCERIIDQAIRDRIDLLIFPELTLTGYFIKDIVASVAITTDNPILEKLLAYSKRISIVIGAVEETPDFKFYNTAFYLEDGRIVHAHRKVYLPTYGLFDEHRYLAAGNKIRAFDTKFGRMGILICEDLWHPTAVTITALDGAHYLIGISCSPGRGIEASDRLGSSITWERLNRTYAQIYSLYVLYCNRTGFEDGINFWGGSEIISPSGEQVIKALYIQEDFIHTTLNDRAIRRERIITPLIRDEQLHLTIQELERIYRERFED